MLTGEGGDMRSLPLSIRKANLARLLARRTDGIFIAPFELGEIVPRVPHATWGSKGRSRSIGIGRTGQGGRRIG
jgi:bifunctional non-homologous end joining protein LigD